MKGFFVGAVVGAAALYFYQRCKEEGGLDRMCDDAKGFASKVKKDVKNTWDKGVNQAEYVKERAESKVETAQHRINEAMK